MTSVYIVKGAESIPFLQSECGKFGFLRTQRYGERRHDVESVVYKGPSILSKSISSSTASTASIKSLPATAKTSLYLQSSFYKNKLFKVFNLLPKTKMYAISKLVVPTIALLGMVQYCPAPRPSFPLSLLPVSV